MRILHVVNHTQRFSGNVHAAVDLACAQAGQGHAVAMCSAGGDFDGPLTLNGVEIMTLSLARRPVALARAIVTIGSLAKRWRADVVHAHMMTSAVLAFPSCRIMRRPLVTTVHNAFEKSADLMRLGDRVIAVSDAVRVSMAQRGVPDRRLRVVLNGTIGSARFPQPGPSAEILPGVSVLYVGGLHPRKGVADLLTAFDMAHRTVPTARLYLVGEGPSEAEYRSLAAALKSSAAITFCGSAADPRSYMRGADIFVLPSLADPAPLVLSEAREAGCAIVGTEVDGIPELLEGGRCGLLVPPRAPNELADALAMLAGNPAMLAVWRRRSQINIDHLSVARVAQDTISIYRECLQATASPRPSGRLFRRRSF